MSGKKSGKNVWTFLIRRGEELRLKYIARDRATCESEAFKAVYDELRKEIGHEDTSFDVWHIGKPDATLNVVRKVDLEVTAYPS